MQYEIENWPAFTVCGFKTRFKSDTAAAFIPRLWQSAFKDGSTERLFKLLAAADLRPAGILGVCCNDVSKAPGIMDYYLAVTTHVNVPNYKALTPPEDMACLQLPAVTWAIFTADGELPAAVQNTINTVLADWPLGAAYTRLNLPMIECYHPDNKQEIWVAVQKTA